MISSITNAVSELWLTDSLSLQYNWNKLELHSKYHSFIYKSWSLWQQTDFTKLKSPFTSLKKISVVMFFFDIPKIKPEKAFYEMVDHDANLLWKVRLQ